MTITRQPRVLCVGATIVDALGRPVSALPSGQQGTLPLDEIRITAAGTAAATAVDLAKLGVDVSLLGAVGDDSLADYLRMTLVGHGVDVAGLIRKPDVQTSATLLPIRPNGDRPALHCVGATPLLEETDLDLTRLAGFDAVHLGAPDVLGPFATSPALKLLSHARTRGLVTTVDVLSPCTGTAWEVLRPLMPYTDYFLPNSEQLHNLTDVADLEAAAQIIINAGAGAVLVTCGPDGCVIATREGSLHVPALPPDAIVDTTGCGDAASAGFITGVLCGWDPLDAAWLAMAAGGLVAGGLGSDAGIVDLQQTAQRITQAAPPPIPDRVTAYLRTHANSSPPTATPLPRYADLPPAGEAGRSGWGLFGDQNSPGAVALQTPSRVARAARLVTTGQMFPLNAPLTTPDPPLFQRRAVRHTMFYEPDTPGFDDALDSFYPQGSSQWDSLAHVGYNSRHFYNGASTDDIRAGARNGIDIWARRGIAGRAILIDVDEVLRRNDRQYNPGTSQPITVEHLETAREIAKVAWRPGDIMLLHTGYLHWYGQQSRGDRECMAASDEFHAVGLERSENIVEYLWDSGLSAVAADNPAVESWPPDWNGGPLGFLHRILIGQLGLALGELWSLHDLAMSCRADKRYEAFLTAAPLNMPGGVGSPANAIAIK